MIAVCLGKHTAAVLLHIEAQLPGPLIPGPEIGAEIPVQKFHAVLPGVFFRRPDDPLVVLVKACQQGGGKVGEAVLSSVTGRALDAVLIAVGAAVVDVSRHMLHELPQAVILPDPHLHADGGGVFQQAVPPGLVFLPGVDVGVVPKGHRLNALGPKGVDTAERARCTAAVEQNGIHRGRPRFHSKVGQVYHKIG